MGTGRGATQVLPLVVGSKGQPQPYTSSPTNSGLPAKPSAWPPPCPPRCLTNRVPMQVKMLLKAKHCLTIVVQQKATQTQTNAFHLLLFNLKKKVKVIPIPFKYRDLQIGPKQD